MKTSLNLRLNAFKIQNFRSIIDSGWKTIANDNISVLIGQNESGKTSVLESLYSFYTGSIHDDVLRSDLSLPIVSCKFDLEGKKIVDFLTKSKIESELYKILESLQSFTLTRRWKETKSSTICISNHEVLEYYDKSDETEQEIEQKTTEKIEELLTQSEELISQMAFAEKAKNDAQAELVRAKKEIDDKSRQLKRAKKSDIQLLAEKEFEIAEKNYNKASQALKKVVDEHEDCKQRTQEISEKVSICKSCITLTNNLKQLEEQINETHRSFKDTQHMYEIATEKDRKSLMSKYEKVSLTYENLQTQYDSFKNDLTLKKHIAAKVFNGTRLYDAEISAKREIEERNNRYTLDDIGEVLFQIIPQFLFFEDFSSLLPNKIDLEDVLNQNEKIEGYKAAQNFLKIAGLDAEFFRETNQRILKQKIENLNGSITINFQDYWSQNVGKNNKIRLNFELEHYDYRTPEKSGKPYIEFWIKDKNERLYPKQRSRGVRWFLSFYLELKAAALEKHQEKVMLIDEPGVSLHAKAQEDVLKVFEDLSQDMQIIYCTHSPHLVDINRIYRLLAVQRANEEDDRSESLIYDSQTLLKATSDTLMPIYTLLGVRVNQQQIIQNRNNILIADPVDYYYLSNLAKISDLGENVYFIPATGLTNIGNLINILKSWKLGYCILLFKAEATEEVLKDINNHTILNGDKEQKEPFVVSQELDYVEDIFSTLDFKKYILKQRVGITDKNSDYIRDNNLSRSILATHFISSFQEEELTLSSFDSETQENVAFLFNKIKNSIN